MILDRDIVVPALSAGIIFNTRATVGECVR